MAQLTDDLGFENHKRLQPRLSALIEMAYQLIAAFWRDTPPCFFNREPGHRMNVTSTCFCVFALKRLPADWERFRASFPGVEARIRAALHDAAWRSEQLDENNIYTAPIALAALAELDHRLDTPKVQEAVSAVIQNVEKHGAARHEPFRESAYLSYWAFRALDSYLSQGRNRRLRRRAQRARDTLVAWAQSEVYRQIACDEASDLDAFDPCQLVYALTTQLTGYTALRSSDRPSAQVTRKALEVIFTSTLPAGLWPRGVPIFSFGDIGSAYPFSFEALDALLTTPGLSLSLRPHVDKLAAFVEWAEQHLMVSEPGLPSGWCSNHASRQDQPESWSTAAVIACSVEIAKTLQRLAQDDVLTGFEAAWPRGRDESELAGLRVGELGGERVADILARTVVHPRLKGSTGANSALLYGPPGSGKTRLARALARALQWPHVKLGSRHFLREGYPQIGSRAEFVFQRLEALNHVVVLFDEFEGLVKAKRGDQYGELLTSCLLELLDALHERADLLYIATTNHLGKIEPAAIRDGRFDLVLYVGPPSRQELDQTLSEAFSEAGLRPPAAARLGVKFWSKAETCLYREWTQVARQATEHVRSGRLRRDKALKQAIAGITGAVESDKTLLEQFKTRESESRLTWRSTLP